MIYTGKGAQRLCTFPLKLVITVQLVGMWTHPSLGKLLCVEVMTISVILARNVT